MIDDGGIYDGRKDNEIFLTDMIVFDSIVK